MQEYYKEKAIEIPYEQADIKKLTKIEDGQYQAVIDKGTLDCILSGDRSQMNVKFALNEIYRVLAPGGVYICVTYGTREQRERYFQRLDWSLTVHRVAKTTVETSKVVEAEKKDDQTFTWVYVLIKPQA